MEEYSLSFLVKDRFLDDKKRRWIREHVQKRECVEFVSLQSAKLQLAYPRWPVEEDSQLKPEATAKEVKARDRSMCRCGRKYRHHRHLQQPSPHNRSRDYRLFSQPLATDLCLQITQTQLSQKRPISYCPKQVIRLAADTELDVLRELIGPIWHVPKSSFLVSVYGSGEGRDNMSDLSQALADLLRVLSNPGSVLLTLALTDWPLYDHALRACDVTWPQLPYAEITPVAIVPWSSLSLKEKRLLETEAERCEGSVEQNKLRGRIRAVDIQKKGYFLLVDYGVHADLGSVTPEELGNRHHRRRHRRRRRRRHHDDNDDDDDHRRHHRHRHHTGLGTVTPEELEADQPLPLPPRNDRRVKKKGKKQKMSDDDDGRDDGSDDDGNGTATDRRLPSVTDNESGPPAAKTSAAGSPSRDGDTLQQDADKASRSPLPAHRSPPGDQGDPRVAIKQPREEGSSGESAGQSASRRAWLMAVNASHRQPTRTLSQSSSEDPDMTVGKQRTPNDDDDDDDDDDDAGSLTSLGGGLPTLPSVDYPATATTGTWGDGEDQGGEMGREKQYKFFTHNFPHPLRGRLETLLKGHTHDVEGQGSLLIMYGATSFLDLAAAHGAIRSGIPVIWDKNGGGATNFLLTILKNLYQRKGKASTDIFIRDRPVVVNDRELQKVIDRYESLLPQFQRYTGQVFRVIRDLVNARQLMTVQDLSSSRSLLAAAVEGLLKARPGQEAVQFLQKNTMRLAAEDDSHPVKLAQQEFQTAVVNLALRLNRPELLDVIMDQGCVSYKRVARDLVDCRHSKGSTHKHKKRQRAEEATEYSEIKELCYMSARGFFIKRVCRLKNIIRWESWDSSSVVHCLFLYAVFNGYTSMARHFWRQPAFQDHVARALVAAHVSRHLAGLIPGDQQVTAFTQQAQDFEALAKGTLNDCYLQDPKRASMIITQQAPALELSPIEAAVSFHMRSFVALPASLDFLDSVWSGEELPSSEDHTNSQSCCTQKCSPLIRFLNAPRTVCIVSTVFYLLFLGLYGHSIIFQSGRGDLSPLDIILIVWALVFLVEEFLQLLRPKCFLIPKGSRKTSFIAKLSLYFSDAWNILDVISLFVFLLGYILRLTMPSSEAGQITLSLVYILFFLRLLRVLTISRRIGPMLPMIRNMLDDLAPFLVILFIFIFAYGLASEALLHAGTSWDGLYLLYLPRMAFWPIFGENGLDNIEGGECENNTLWYTEPGAAVLCPSSIGRHIVPVLMGVYILITNVLMLNLLIAYFNHSFQKVHTESHMWWAWLRCGLIGEYYDRPLLPPPFVLLYRLGQVLARILRAIFLALRGCYRCLRGGSAMCFGLKLGDSGPEERVMSTRPRAKAGRRILPTGDEPLDFLGEPLPGAGLHEVFAEQAEVLDALDLEEFRFSNLGSETDHKKAFISESSAVPAVNERDTKGMSKLKKWEAAIATSRMMAMHGPAASGQDAQHRSQASSQKEALPEDLELLLLRLEKKIEDSKQQFDALNNALSKNAEQ